MATQPDERPALDVQNDISGAYIDIDEWRDKPVRHRYVHGGFKGTHTLFSFYFPPKEQYKGRFTQYLEGGAGGHENLLAASAYGPAMSFDWLYRLNFDELGAYIVESNQGHYPGEGLGFESDYELYGASAQTALYGRKVAAQMYGTAPHHGYVWGVSGGGARSGQCLENRPDIWQGGCPHAGIGQSTQWSPWCMAWLFAREKFPNIIDAMEPGGSGTPFEGLSHVQREAVADMYRRGWPRGAENQLAPFMAWAFPMYAAGDRDPEYFANFWEKSGYLGHDDPRALAGVRISQKAKVKRVVPASLVNNLSAQMHVRLATAGAAGSDPSWGVVLDIADPKRLVMSKVKILTGKAQGRELLITSVEEDGVLSPFSERTPDVFEGVAEGDEVVIDNKDFIAYCFYHRHTLTETGPNGGIDTTYEPWVVDGNPVYPQRGGKQRIPSAPTSYKANLSNKMIYVQPTHDAQVWPTTIFQYMHLLQANLGDRCPDHFRLWFVENSPHGTPEFLGPLLTDEKDPGVWSSRLVDYNGVSAEALRQVVRWVEEGVAPTSYKGYRLTRDNALSLPKSAAERGGVQPLVIARANGAVRADIKVGQTVTFEGQAEQPTGPGTIVRAEWDFEGRGKWEHKHADIDGASPRISVSATHTYAKPGTYFASFRVGAHSQGKEGRGPTVQNLARVRVVVNI